MAVLGCRGFQNFRAVGNSRAILFRAILLSPISCFLGGPKWTISFFGVFRVVVGRPNGAIPLASRSRDLAIKFLTALIRTPFLAILSRFSSPPLVLLQVDASFDVPGHSAAWEKNPGTRRAGSRLLASKHNLIGEFDCDLGACSSASIFLRPPSLLLLSFSSSSPVAFPLALVFPSRRPPSPPFVFLCLITNASLGKRPHPRVRRGPRQSPRTSPSNENREWHEMPTVRRYWCDS